MNQAYLNGFSIYYDDFVIDRNGFCEISIYVSLAVAYYLNRMQSRDYVHSVLVCSNGKYDLVITSIDTSDISYNSFKDYDDRLLKFKLNCYMIDMNISLVYKHDDVVLVPTNFRKKRIEKFLEKIDNYISLK